MEIYELEDTIDQTTLSGAIQLMRRRIMGPVNECNKCTDTDRFIAAALAQNSGFTQESMRNVSDKNAKDNYRYVDLENRIIEHHDGTTIKWREYFNKRDDWLDTYQQVNRFHRAVSDLNKLGWSVPDNLRQGTISSLSHSGFWR